jgi:uncharacterized phage protein (TIGR01671 family)
MREILFRGKRKDNGEWIEGGYYREDYTDNVYITFWNSFGLGFMDSCQVERSTVGQYIGLEDKNGKRIFEGDIVEYNDGYDYFKGEVVFENGSFGVGSREVIGLSTGCCDNFANLWQLFWDQEVTDEPELYYCTVIGNIHDNPKLMEDNNAK